MNLFSKSHVKEALHTCFFAVKGKLLFIWQKFYIIQVRKQNRLEEQEQSNINIGTQILKIRKEKGLTQEEFGKIFHVTRQTVSNWENEKRFTFMEKQIRAI